MYVSGQLHPWYPLYMRQSGPQSRSGRCEEKNLALPGIEPWSSSPQLVTLPTELSRLILLLFFLKQYHFLRNCVLSRDFFLTCDKIRCFLYRGPLLVRLSYSFGSSSFPYPLSLGPPDHLPCKISIQTKRVLNQQSSTLQIEAELASDTFGIQVQVLDDQCLNYIR
jgi:hypothetical protein